MKNLTNVQKLTLSGLVIALYLAVMVCTQGFAFGQYQVRIATALYGLSALFPFLVVPFGLANLLSNTIMGGLGPVDMIGGALMGLCTSGSIVLAKRAGLGNWVLVPLITLIPGLAVPAWLSVLIDVPYWILAASLLVGQLICGIVGMLLVNALERCQVAAWNGAKDHQ